MDKIRNNIKLIIGIFIGIVISCNSIVFAYTFASNEIRHVKSDNTETSVDIALNELYQMYDADNIILSKIYPVGSIYVSVNNVSPQTIFGGTWTELTDTMLMSHGSTYATVNSSTYTSDAGSASVTLAANQIPTLTGISGTTNTTGAHTHTIAYIDGNKDLVYQLFGTSGTTYLGAKINNTTTGGHLFARSAGNHSHTFSDGTYTNSNQQSVSILPPYKVVYMWVRTA